jgi:hypothetical protein
MYRIQPVLGNLYVDTVHCSVRGVVLFCDRRMLRGQSRHFASADRVSRTWTRTVYRVSRKPIF